MQYTTNANWTGQTWVIVASDPNLQELQSCSGATQFTLEPIWEGGAITRFAVKPSNACELAPCLQNCSLTPMGTTPLKEIGGKLPIYSDSERATYTAAADNVLREAAEQDVMRLEGTITMSDGECSLRLYQLEKAIEDDKSLLVLWVPPHGSANPDGSAIGHN